MTDSQQIKEMLLRAPDGQIAHSLFPLIQQWDTPPRAIQILEVLDQSARYALASDFAMGVLDKLLQIAIETENTTYEAVVEDATWRK
jgi:hypothetical protein